MHEAQNLDKSESSPDPTVAYSVQIDDGDSVAGIPASEHIKTGEWEDGLFECCSSCVPNCCMVSFCPCVSVAQVVHQLQIMPYNFALLVSCFSVVAGLGFLHCIFVWQLRWTIRERFNIPGSCCGDCCSATCCNCCALAQVATHVKSYRPGTCDFGAPDTLPSYQYL